MTFHEGALWLSTICVFCSGFRYIYSILRGKTKPNLIGWLLYEIAAICVLISSYDIGAESTIVASLSYAVIQLIIIVLAFRYGYARMAPIEGVYFTISIFSLVFWAVMIHSPDAEIFMHLDSREISIIILSVNTFIDLMGAVSIFTKLYQHPETEDALSWFFAMAGGLLSILAVSEYTFHELLYPAYLFLSNLAIFILCFRKKPRHRFAKLFDFIQKFVGKSWRE